MPESHEMTTHYSSTGRVTLCGRSLVFKFDIKHTRLIESVDCLDCCKRHKVRAETIAQLEHDRAELEREISEATR